MTTNAPLSSDLPSASGEEARLCDTSTLVAHPGQEVKESSREKLEKGLRHHGPEGKPGVWTGSRDGIVATIIAIAASLIFGGAAGNWFGPSEHGWVGQLLTISGGTMLMAAAVCLLGSLISGRNPIFWGMGMPLLVYVAGSFCALVSGQAGVSAFLFGAPLFCGLAILAGVMCAYVLDKGD
ncbi:hypothetical protein [Luteolibacter luteus]|uniref:Uncharacterized protein n=1 Tax=Luteolibacter luteus TaxID=2728835 RepID=A0A858RMI1_9BACT|nr:hypothetical protein [Luteolibacter luteus]QJE97694.1 hypothetical protein HHL09_18540 [Luteolibacter luteus]